MRALSALLCAAVIVAAASPIAFAASHPATADGWTVLARYALVTLAAGLVAGSVAAIVGALFNYFLNKKILTREYRTRSADFYWNKLRNSVSEFWNNRAPDAYSLFQADAEYLKKYSETCGKYSEIKFMLQTVTSSLNLMIDQQEQPSDILIYYQVIGNLVEIRQTLAA